MQQTGTGGVVPSRASRTQTREQIRPTVRLENVLKHAGSRSVIDYMSIDLEGGEDAALLHFPFNRPWTVRGLSVERPSPRLEPTLLQHGYHFVRTHGSYGDCMYAHHSVPNLTRTLSHYNPTASRTCTWTEDQSAWDGCPYPHHIKKEFHHKYTRCWKRAASRRARAPLKR